MVKLTLALSAFLFTNTDVLAVRTSPSRRAEFVSHMRNLVKDPELQAQRQRRDQALTQTIVSKAKIGGRRLEDAAEEEVEYYQDEAAEEGDDEEAEYYAAEEDDAAKEDDAAEEEAAEEENNNQSYYAKAWGNDDDYDYSAMTTFDISKFSLKFHSCRGLTDFDLDQVQEEEEDAEDAQDREQQKEEGAGYPFTATPYVNFRLCPATTCGDDTWKGCRNIYGTYMVPLEDYLEATEQHLEEEAEEYCDYCASCNYFYYYFNAQCEFYDDCQNYADVCNANDDDGNNNNNNAAVEEANYDEFMECTAVNKAYYQQYYNNGNNNRRTEENEQQEYDENVYLKIFCDGSVKIGIFSDDECTNYIGRTTTIYEATGLELKESDVETNVMKKSCVSCGKTNNKYYVLNQEQAEEQENADDQAEVEDELYEICEDLYEDAAKCNANLPHTNYYGDGYYDEEWEETTNSRTCSFIEAVQKGNIDRYGYVHLSRSTFFSNFINKVNNDFLPQGYYFTDKQFYGVIFGCIVCLALAAYGVSPTIPKALKSKSRRRRSVKNKQLKHTLV